MSAPEQTDDFEAFGMVVLEFSWTVVTPESLVPMSMYFRIQQKRIAFLRPFFS